MKDSEICFAAAKYIEEHGHTKLQIQNEDGAVCISGAVGTVLKANNYRDSGAIANAIRKIIGTRPWSALTPTIIHDIVEWNDRPSTEPQEVIDTLNWAGKLLEEEEQLKGLT